MSRIDRYLLGTLLGSFGMASLVLVMVYWVNQAVMLFDQLIRDGQTAWVFLEFTALALPTIVRIVWPPNRPLPHQPTIRLLSRVKKVAGFRLVQRWGWSGWRGQDVPPAAGSKTVPRVV